MAGVSEAQGRWKQKRPPSYGSTCDSKPGKTGTDRERRHLVQKCPLLHTTTRVKIVEFPYLLGKVEFGYRRFLGPGAIYMKLPRGQGAKEAKRESTQNSLLKTSGRSTSGLSSCLRNSGGSKWNDCWIYAFLKTEYQSPAHYHPYPHFQTVLTQFYIPI